MAAKSPSMQGLLAATDPSVLASKAIGGEAAANEDLGANGGMSITDYLNPQWGKWLTMLNHAAPGGISTKRTPSQGDL